MQTDDPGRLASPLTEGLGLAPERENAEERHCYQMLAELRRSYERDAKPYIDRLVAIKGVQPTPRIVLALDQAREFIGLAMGGSDGEPGCRDCADNDGTCPHDGHKCGA